MTLEDETNWRSIWIANIIAFIGSVQNTSIVPTVWPYLKKIDISTTETLYGFIRGLNALGQTLAAIISGYFTNKIEDTKPSMISAKILVILAAFCFCFMGIFPSAYIIFFIVFEFVLGVATGTGSVYRTHVAMASTEADRSKAYASTQLSMAIGMIAGP
uniref:Major facilitator superfamily (MFS) profile domain-containing protein n=1 Tax=Panagrolaimus sp. JU765 TaxID=591449 RepID=A0AC34PYM5_9BILA